MPVPLWTIIIAVLGVAGHAVPYLLLAGNETWSGAFLFWLVFGAVTWLVLVLVVMRWDAEASRRLKHEGRP